MPKGGGKDQYMNDCMLSALQKRSNSITDHKPKQNRICNSLGNLEKSQSFGKIFVQAQQLSRYISLTALVA